MMDSQLVQMRATGDTEFTLQERILYQIACQLLGRDDFSMTDDLREFGLTVPLSNQLMALANKQGFQLRPTDIVRFHSIRALCKTNGVMFYWQDGYHPEKPVMLYVHGISLATNVVPRLDEWCERFSVLVIEPLPDHYKSIFLNESLEEISEFYYALYEVFFPEKPQVLAVVGASFGGVMAYFLANKLYEHTGQLPYVYLFDSVLAITEKFKRFISLVREPYFKERLTTMLSVMLKTPTFPVYPGPLVLFNATQRLYAKEENLAAWRQHASQLEIIDVDCDHEEICREAAFIQIINDKIYGDLEKR